MKSILTALILFSLTPLTTVQLSPAPERKTQEGSITTRQITELPLTKRNFRPKLSLQQALKLAEKHIAKNRIDISPYYLYEAKLILYGEEGSKEPAWSFWWANEKGLIGDYVLIKVLINSGEIRQTPSM